MGATWKSEAVRQEAQTGKCCECGHVMSRGFPMAWTLRKTFAMHEAGTGHKKFSVETYA